MRLFNKSEPIDFEEKVEEKSYDTGRHEPVPVPETDSYKEPYVAPISEESLGKRLVEEDSLLVQIDAFREKAQTLQALINDRQNKVIELEDVVREKEIKNVALKEELQHKQDALEGVLEDIRSQLDIFATRVDTSVNNAVDGAKEPILEKVHSENVRLYRNLYDFVKEEYNKKEMQEMMERGAKQNSGIMKTMLILSIVNTVFLVFLIVYNLGLLPI